MTMSYSAILQHDFLTQAEMYVCSLHQELQWCVLTDLSKLTNWRHQQNIMDIVYHTSVKC